MRWIFTRKEQSHDNRTTQYSPDQGQSFYFLGTLMTLKAGSAETNGQFSLIEQVSPPGFATPLHVHHGEDEAMYILEGMFTFFVGDEVINAAPGSFVYMPRDVPHAFRIEGEMPARLLQLTTPAGIEQGFIEMGEPAVSRTLPPPHMPTQEQIGRMAAISAKYNVEQLGPPRATTHKGDEANANTRQSSARR